MADHTVFGSQDFALGVLVTRTTIKGRLGTGTQIDIAVHIQCAIRDGAAIIVHFAAFAVYVFEGACLGLYADAVALSGRFERVWLMANVIGCICV